MFDRDCRRTEAITGEMRKPSLCVCVCVCDFLQRLTAVSPAAHVQQSAAATVRTNPRHSRFCGGECCDDVICVVVIRKHTHWIMYSRWQLTDHASHFHFHTDSNEIKAKSDRSRLQPWKILIENKTWYLTPWH